MRAPLVALLVAFLAALGGASCAIDREGRLRGDAGPGIRDGCTPAAETCNETDDDCDGRVDEAFDLESDVANCGRCGTVCTGDPPNASPSCSMGSCKIACDPSFGDCDADAVNGCEASLSDPASCGACGTSCSDPTPFCDGTRCVDTCEAPRTACRMSCVDLASDPSHCGRCDAPCTAGAHQSASCVASSCMTACDATFGDCDGAPSTGCEQALDDVAHCGACGAPCDFVGASAETCPGGSCTMGPCNPGLGDCDLLPETGCETSLSTDAHCGGCGVACSEPTPACGTDAMGGVSCVSGCSSGETRCGSSCVITDTDPSHCGACDNACGMPPGSVSTSCMGGTCLLVCGPLVSDCNATFADGCEESLETLSSCGSCGAPCAPANATGTCAGGTCAIERCETGFFDCNLMPGDGCESSMPCPCAMGCAPTCDLGLCCTESCRDDRDCGVTCNGGIGGATGCECDVDCVSHDNTCTTTCEPGSSCRVNCTDANVCIVNCPAGAACRLECSRAGTCRIDGCPGGAVHCGSQVYVCGRGC